MVKFFRLSCAVFVLFALVGCKSKPAARALPDPNPAGGSVYDRQGGSSRDGNEVGDGTALEDEDVTSDVLGEPIDSATLGPITNLDDFSNEGTVDLNWPPIFFEFDQDVLSETAKQELSEHAEEMKRNPRLVVLLEGHCDSRGTEDYNLALGERRAQSVRRYLVQLGVAEERMRTMSYGELRPLVNSENESAWARNRRVSFTF